MNTSEIRIGNIISCNGKPEIVTGVLQYGVYFAFGYCPNVHDLLQPIPLTEEWLLRCGFENENENSYLSEEVNNQRIRIKSPNLKGYKEFVWQYSMFSDVELNSVHQLQNLYFALTGQELTATNP